MRFEWAVAPITQLLMPREGLPSIAVIRHISNLVSIARITARIDSPESSFTASVSGR